MRDLDIVVVKGRGCEGRRRQRSPRQGIPQVVSLMPEDAAGVPEYCRAG
jgi:hypothetical protein